MNSTICALFAAIGFAASCGSYPIYLGQQNLAYPRSCGASDRTSIAPAELVVAPRAVTFRAHLREQLADDPVVNPGETIRVVPDPSEPTMLKNSIVVSLPTRTPYQTPEEALNYLRGYSIGQLSSANVFRH